jgi:kynureninase
VATDAEAARALDARDPLARFRQAFVVADPELIYLDGNSLGRLPRAAATRVRVMVEEWGGRLIRGWTDRWFTLAQRLGAKLADLLGAESDERRSTAWSGWSATAFTRSTRPSAPPSPEGSGFHCAFPRSLPRRPARRKRECTVKA